MFHRILHQRVKLNFVIELIFPSPEHLDHIKWLPQDKYNEINSLKKRYFKSGKK
jgi:hypothetical protein